MGSVQFTDAQTRPTEFLDLTSLTHVQGGVVRGSEFCSVAVPRYQAWSIPTASQTSR
jgi:hypothetical protein